MFRRQFRPGGASRVVRVIARLNVGGPAQHAVYLTAGMQARYPTVLATGSTEPHEADMSAFARSRGLRPYRITELRQRVRPLDDLMALWKLYRLFRRLRPQIVHTHTAKAGTLGRLAAWLAGVPVRVHTFHGHTFRGYFGRLQTVLFITIERLLARITDRIVAISPRQAEELKNYLRTPSGQITVIPLGLDLERLISGDPATPRRLFRVHIGATEDEVVVSVVGRLTAIKNNALALRAVARVSTSVPRVLLAFVGGGEEEGRLRDLARELGVAERVRFAGWWSDLAAVYYGSDVIALTSDNEGTPVCLIEALACGRPVIATDVGGVADVLANGEFGMLVPPGDEEALARALKKLSDPAVRARMAGLGAEDVRRRYSVSRLVADMETLYDQLLRERDSPRSRVREPRVSFDRA